MSDDLKARLRAAIDDCGWDGIDETVVEEAIARIATLETRVEVEVELRKASYERITDLEAGLLDALHVINGEFSHGPDDDLTIDEWLTDD